MKNVHVLPTDNYSPLVYSTNKYGGLFLSKYYTPMKNMGDSYQHIYITSDEEIKEGDWYFITESISKCESKYEANDLTDICKKIILTTDQSLDGVQAIDDEFLEWFVKNPNCEEVEVVKGFADGTNYGYNFLDYKIIIPKEEPKQDLEKEMFELEEQLDIPSHLRWHNSKPKQETLEEAAKEFVLSHDFSKLTNPNHLANRCFQFGAKWLQERMYSEEDMKACWTACLDFNKPAGFDNGVNFDDFIKQFKKKQSGE